MTNSANQIVFYTNTTPSLESLAMVAKLFKDIAISPDCQIVEQSINQKWLKTIRHNRQNALLIDEKGEVSLLGHGLAVRPNWSALQQRVVKAGKKSELLLKAMRLQSTMTVIDATAGFGHDSLILASTGANVVMIEQQPLMYILLKIELQKMALHPNWQKLISRLSVFFGDSVAMIQKLPKADRIYLDPMFPQDSYKAAVNKHMQVLHQIAAPPDTITEQNLLSNALSHLNTNGLVMVKRPKHAPFFANLSPNSSTYNELVRFDEYHELQMR